MEKDLEQKLAGSLTAQTADLLPYLQDLWELGTSLNWIINAIKKHIKYTIKQRFLTLRVVNAR